MKAAVTVVSALDDATYSAWCRLLPQLSSTAATPTRERLQEVIAVPGNRVLVASAKSEIIGFLTVVVVPIPTGRVALIEDVVVDERVRGEGIGRSLVVAAIDIARTAGARHIDLTSRPIREAGNNLYQSLGFFQRDTNVYRLQVTS
jgi:ribosomal protein S18 acetylase RimI-like enzyme